MWNGKKKYKIMSSRTIKWKKENTNDSLSTQRMNYFHFWSNLWAIRGRKFVLVNWLDVGRCFWSFFLWIWIWMTGSNPTLCLKIIQFLKKCAINQTFPTINLNFNVPKENSFSINISRSKSTPSRMSIQLALKETHSIGRAISYRWQ